MPPITPTGAGALGVNQAAARARGAATARTFSGGATRIDPTADPTRFGLLQLQAQEGRELALSKLEGRNLRGGLYLSRDQVAGFRPTFTGDALLDELVRRGYTGAELGERGQYVVDPFEALRLGGGGGRGIVAPASTSFGFDGTPIAATGPEPRAVSPDTKKTLMIAAAGVVATFLLGRFFK